MTRRIAAPIFALFLVSACSSSPSSAPTFTSSSVVQAFASAGLEAGSPTTMTVADFGTAPHLTTDGTHFLVPSACSGCGGRALVFTSLSDLQTTKAYYDNLGKSSAALFSWTFENDKRLVLVQINGQLSKDKADKYGVVVTGL